VKCDVCSWEEQVSLFEAALLNSPHKSIDIVIANAGLGPPTKPDLHILDVNLKGTLYTTRLALHYFRRLQLETNGQSDRCLILKSSLSAYVDWERSLQYPVSKVGIRGLMKCLRRSLWKDGIRVNLVAPA
jgi:NAD(P)-dependent dehydrogenase (short-subunit alcohol dehydrogenase family)